jgi:hypothetical protein
MKKGTHFGEKVGSNGIQTRSPHRSFGPIPRIPPILTMNGECIPFKSSYPYVGLLFTSVKANYFIEHYKKKAQTARLCSRRVFTIELHIGVNKDWLYLYTALVDCHLTHGCEIMPGVCQMNLLSTCAMNFSQLASLSTGIGKFFFHCQTMMLLID